MKTVNISGDILVGVKGFLRLQRVNIHTGKITQDTGWFQNLILTAGREQMGKLDNWMDYCHVGTNSTVPTINDTSLPGFIDSTSQVVANSEGQQTLSLPYYGYRRRTFRFDPGLIGLENLQEAGIGWGASGSTLISRALILDPILQTPTAITPLADEFLDVSYELRYYSPAGEVSGPQVTLNGITYDTVTKAANVNSGYQSTNIGRKMGVVAGAPYWKAYDGTRGTVLTGPNGAGLNCDNDTQYNSTYIDNSYEIQVNVQANSAGWNQNIRCILFTTTAGQFQTEFTANPGGTAIPKTADYVIQMNWTFGWTAI